MADEIDVLIEDDRWNDIKLLVLCEIAFNAVFVERGLAGRGYSVSVLACDDAKIAVLNAEFRGKPTPTNVLSWPEMDLAALNDGGEPALPEDTADGMFDPSLGDIAVSFDTCKREAEAGQIKFEDHLMHLLIHSCLHLLGFDHETDADAARMEGLETKMLASLGIADPY